MKMLKWCFIYCFSISVLACTKVPPLLSQDKHLTALPCPKLYSLAPFQQKYVIVIDPGHGGKDFGSESAVRATEKELNLKTAKFAAAYLQQMGYQVTLTRHSDYFVSLAKRASLANSCQADLFISIHFNSAPSQSAEGIEIFYFRPDANRMRVNASKRLAQEVLNKIIEETAAKSRGVKDGNLAVIRETNMPAILIEGGFLTHPKERERILETAYQKRIAKGLAMGVREYIRHTPLLFN